ncbi:hypothetical protein CGLO_16480 [Colletotrichum gloeosporioides Cg-14]|uniref:Uncharacterized protein n=1 Tax=Colletotrichum gloeosporioides (strain Cg-14) TaxID=1237896 RepID=T0JYY7_COLGC|nr:hypothetical protein CGLO_16480 [Colletotrichum gloeosporioides Cg-14]
MPAVTNYRVNVVDISERFDGSRSLHAWPAYTTTASGSTVSRISFRSTDFKQPEALRQAGIPLQVLGLDRSGRLLFG